MEYAIQHDVSARRFHTDVGGLESELVYRLSDGVMRIAHTGVPTPLEGQGIAAALIEALTARAGRRTSPSSFDENGYYVSNYLRAQFISPFARNFRLTVSGALYFNDYPVADVNGVLRNDDIWSGGAGVAYFFTPLTFLSVDYRHDRRSSNIDLFGYESNALQLMMGFGFLNR